MTEEIFGPVLTVSAFIHRSNAQVYIYEDDDWSNVLKLVDESSDYALTGSMYKLHINYLTIDLQRIVPPFLKQPMRFVTRLVSILLYDNNCRQFLCER